MNLLGNHGLKTILLISLVYGGLVGYGIYGFSNDFYDEYSKSNLRYDSWREYGISLATLTIYGKHIGVYLTSFFLAFSSGLILKSFFEAKSIKSISFFLFIFLITLHTHPIIMSTSGAMRQGWTMIFIFFSFVFLLKEKNFLSFIMILTAVFMHKSGLFFFVIYLLAMFSSYLIKKKIKQKKYILIIASLIGVVLQIIYIQTIDRSGQRIVSGDFRIGWLIINFSYILFYIFGDKFYLSSKINKFGLFFYFHSLFAFIMVINDFTYFYERINMVISIPYILTTLSCIKKDQYYFVLILTMCIYLFITIYQGMYTIGLT
jgi:hypothetical protein